MPNIILVRNEYKDTGALRRVINYALSGSVIGGYGLDPNYAFEQMILVKPTHDKINGCQLKHFVISFTSQEMMHLDFDDILEMGFRVGTFLKDYQLVYGIHLDTQHVHMHCVMNTVSFRDGHKFCDGLMAFQRLCSFLKAEYPYLFTYLCYSDIYR